MWFEESNTKERRNNKSYESSLLPPFPSSFSPFLFWVGHRLARGLLITNSPPSLFIILPLPHEHADIPIQLGYLSARCHNVRVDIEMGPSSASAGAAGRTWFISSCGLIEGPAIVYFLISRHLPVCPIPIPSPTAQPPTGKVYKEKQKKKKLRTFFSRQSIQSNSEPKKKGV